jgi:hypothetical protein
MENMVRLYNVTPHKAYNNIFTPMDVQNDREIEGIFIRTNLKRLEQIHDRQNEAELLDYRPGNIIFV